MKSHFSTCVLLYVGFLVVLGAQTFSPYRPEPELAGVVESVQPPVLSATNWWNGSFQRRVEGTPEEGGWVDVNLAVRSVFIKTDNQINFSLFREASTTMNPQGVILGKDNWLFEDGYVDNFLNVDVVPQEQLRKNAIDLRQLQDELDRRGIAMLVVVSPSKLPLYSEYLPDWILEQREVQRRKHPNRTSNYDVLRPLLDEQGVRWIDAIARFREEKRKQQETGQEYRLFPRGGTHWSEYGATLIAETMLARLRELTGKDLTQLAIEDITVDCETTTTDNDIGDVLNLWTTSAAKGPTPHPHVIGTPGDWQPNVLWVGCSFSFTLTDLMDLFRVYSRRDTLFNFARRLSYPEKTDFRLTDVPVNWPEELLSRDIVIVETNEAHLDEFAYGFLEAALEFLENQPPP